MTFDEGARARERESQRERERICGSYGLPYIAFSADNSKAQYTLARTYTKAHTHSLIPKYTSRVPAQSVLLSNI